MLSLRNNPDLTNLDLIEPLAARNPGLERIEVDGQLLLVLGDF